MLPHRRYGRSRWRFSRRSKSGCRAGSPPRIEACNEGYIRPDAGEVLLVARDPSKVEERVRAPSPALLGLTCKQVAHRRSSQGSAPPRGSSSRQLGTVDVIESGLPRAHFELASDVEELVAQVVEFQDDRIPSPQSTHGLSAKYSNRYFVRASRVALLSRRRNPLRWLRSASCRTRIGRRDTC